MKLNVLFITLLIGLCLAVAPSGAVSVYLQNGMQLTTYITTPATPDTNSMSRVVVDGDVYDFGRSDGTTTYSGKLLGRVSCSNYSAQAFAGMSGISAGTRNGIITRFTMPYQYPFNSAVANFVRWYRITNRGVDLTAQPLAFAFNTSEVNSVPQPYAMKRWHSGAWTDYNNGTGGDNGADGDVDVVNAVIPGSGATSDWIYVNMQIPRVFARVMLDGPFFAQVNQYPEDLSKKYMVISSDWQTPFFARTTDPFGTLTSLPMTVPAVRNKIFNASGEEIIDFVEVQLRTAKDSPTVGYGVGYVDTSGYVYDLYGDPGIQVDAPMGSYYLVIYNQNHLPVQSANTVNLANLTGYGSYSQYFDFTRKSYVLNQNPTVPVQNDGVKLVKKFYLEPGNTTPTEYIVQVPDELNPGQMRDLYALWPGNAAGAGGWEYDLDENVNSKLPRIVYSEEANGGIRANSGTFPYYGRLDVTMNGRVIYSQEMNKLRMSSGSISQVDLPLRKTNP